MSKDNKAYVNKIIGKTFMDIAKGLETGDFGGKVKVGLTTLGSEHGVENLVRGAESLRGEVEVVLIGPKADTDLEQFECNTEAEVQSKLEELLDSGYISACVTMHYSFPIGISTVGRVVTPGKGKEMFLATTTGTSSPHRTEAMVINAISGIATAKAMGIARPKVGILNLDGARQAERILTQLGEGGYDINFSESQRADGGVVMRGNDLLMGTPDVMVMDTLTGNVMMKVFSSYSTGGDFEALGYGYGPGVGKEMKRIVLILSRASGTPVVANAIRYGAELAKGKLIDIAHAEFAAAEKAGLKALLDAATKPAKAETVSEEVVAPAKEVVTGQIAGVDIMDLEDAVKALWKAGIYAESGMGCTGPIVMVHEDKIAQAQKVLGAAGYLAVSKSYC